MSTSKASYRLSQIADRMQVSKRTITRWTELGMMPKPIRLGRVILWNAETIERWIEAGCPRQKGGVK